jgi:hypothetical protein
MATIDPTVPGQAPKFGFTIKEFCRSHGFSVAYFYKHRDLMPSVMDLPGRQIITAEAAAAWRAARTAAGREAQAAGLADGGGE